MLSQQDKRRKTRVIMTGAEMKTVTTTMTKRQASKLRSELSKIDGGSPPKNIGDVKKIMHATLGGLVRKKKRDEADINEI